MITTQPISPCKGCSDRHVTIDYNCHSEGNCSKYDNYQEFCAARRHQNSIDNGIDGYVINTCERNKIKNPKYKNEVES